MIDDRDYVGYGADPPDPQWPGGARIAVNINLNLEGGGQPATPRAPRFVEGTGLSINTIYPSPDLHIAGATL
jgi:hypothetical protein